MLIRSKILVKFTRENLKNIGSFFSNKEHKIKKELCNIMYYIMNFNIKIIKKEQ